MRVKAKIFALVFTIIGLVIGASSLFPRDGFFTLGIESFQPSKIVSERLWAEHPIQVLATFFPSDTTKFYGLAGQDPTSQELSNRLALIYGASSVDKVNDFFDVSASLSEAEQVSSEAYFRKLTYYTTLPCPHDADKDCSVGVGWNRDVTKQQNVSFFFIRATDDKYIFVDESLLEVGD